MLSPIASSIAFFFFLFSTALAGAPHADAVDYLPPETAKVSFGPSVKIATAVFCVMLSLTIILLVCVKCRQHPAPTVASQLFDGGGGDGRRSIHHHQPSSGVHRSAVESLPFFRFSSLRGVRDGLECAVCLSRFAGDEVLRLLPKCKHAFHIGCVDRWLETNSTCPLCRCAVDAGDAAPFAYSTSSRFLFASGRHESGRCIGGDLELFVERERDEDVRCQESSSSRRFAAAVGGGFWKETVFAKEKASGKGEQFFHRVKHKIIVSDVVFKGRWSALSSSDLVSLDSDMLKLSSSDRFAAEKYSSADEGKSVEEERTLLESEVKRSMSEITNLSRSGKGNGSSMRAEKDDEKVRRIWLPIARRTVQCFAGRRHCGLAKAQEETPQCV